MKNRIRITALVATTVLLGSCQFTGRSDQGPNPRLSMFVGVDISGSFMNSGYFDDSIDFLAHYIHSHVNGVGGLEVPNALYVSSIGGATVDEPKTFYPIQTFQNKSVDEIRQTLQDMFPKTQSNPFTDYNAFFEQVAHTVKTKNLLLRPISIVMVSDGIPDVARGGKTQYESIEVRPLERLARSVTIRLLYTDAVVGKNWQTKVTRQRVKIWTQDASVMVAWKDTKIMLPETPLQEQDHFFAWVNDSVDFGVRARRVN
jgi:hypothetical protein